MDVLDHECPSCGAQLPFNPKSQKWDCPYCGSSYSLEELTEIEEKIKKASDESVSIDEYTCSNCGAGIIADQNTSATFCVYCGSASIIKSQFKGEFKPDKIIPFKNTKEEVVKKFRGFAKGKIFAPKDFTDMKNLEKVTGVYIPFWTYDADVSARLDGIGKNTKTWRSGDYVYTKTDEYTVMRDGTMKYERVPADGSKKFDDDTMDSVEPFDYSGIKDFNMSYLSGFLSEKYDVSKEEAKKRADSRIINSSKDELLKTAKYQSVSVSNMNCNIDNKKTEYVLLPVWMLNIKYNDKLHLFAMNGQTGKMVGNVPIDNKKRVLAAIGAFLGSTAILSLITLIIRLFG